MNEASATNTPDPHEGVVTPEFELSALQQTLEEAWEEIRERHPDVPHAVITIGTGTTGRKLTKLGHWACFRWRVAGGKNVGEVLIAGELLSDGAEAVLHVLVHEAAHAVATVRKIKDTSRDGRYHNERYADLARELGLDCKKDMRAIYGWSDTSLRTETRESYSAEITMISLALGGWRHRPAEAVKAAIEEGEDLADSSAAGKRREGEKKKRERSLLVCRCTEPRKIRMSASVAKLGPVTCGVCKEAFSSPVDEQHDHEEEEDDKRMTG